MESPLPPRRAASPARGAGGRPRWEGPGPTALGCDPGGRAGPTALAPESGGACATLAGDAWAGKPLLPPRKGGKGRGPKRPCVRDRREIPAKQALERDPVGGGGGEGRPMARVGTAALWQTLNPTPLTLNPIIKP